MTQNKLQNFKETYIGFQQTKGYDDVITSPALKALSVGIECFTPFVMTIGEQ